MNVKIIIYFVNILLYWVPNVILGGATLYIETVLKRALEIGSDKDGAMEVTGNLGKVMQESIQLAYTYAKSYMTQTEPDNNFLQKAQLHLHVPEVRSVRLSFLLQHFDFFDVTLKIHIKSCLSF